MRVLVRPRKKPWTYREKAAMVKLRPVVYRRDHWHCVYCQKRVAVVLDHVIPRSRGGKTTLANLVAACSSCNSRKGTKLLSELGWEIRPIEWVAP